MDKIVMKVTGMGCEHCAARVKAALETVPGVEKAKVEFSSKTAEITPAEGAAVTAEALKAAVAALGGKYVLE